MRAFTRQGVSNEDATELHYGKNEGAVGTKIGKSLMHHSFFLSQVPHSCECVMLKHRNVLLGKIAKG